MPLAPSGHDHPDRIGGRKLSGYGMLIGPGPKHPLYAKFLIHMKNFNLKKGNTLKKTG